MISEPSLPTAPVTGKRDSLSPLDGELGIPSVTQASKRPVSWKGLFAVALAAFSLLAVTAGALNRAISGSKKSEAEATPAGERPVAAGNEPRKLDMALAPLGAAPSPAKPIPAIAPLADDIDAAPIPVRRTGTSSSGSSASQRTSPEDAPVLLVSSRPGSNATPPLTEPPPPDDPLLTTSRNLETYQRQLQRLVDELNRQAAAPHAPAIASLATGAPLLTAASPEGVPGLFGGQLPSSVTAKVRATHLRNRSLTLPKGASFTCALRTRIISAASGMVGCQVQRNVYGDDGRVLLIERGSQMDGEYRITSVRPGTVRVPVLWTRVRTPNGVTVDLDSPATGPLGEAGIEGYVDNRWMERIGAAMLLSLIDDAVKLTLQNQADDRQANTVILPSTTSNTSKLAEKVLDSTINIPPLIYQNQGGIVGIYVARDVDFSTVYELKAVPR